MFSFNALFCVGGLRYENDVQENLQREEVVKKTVKDNTKFIFIFTHLFFMGYIKCNSMDNGLEGLF